jgi:cellulose synthase/poly-beta-1,6-N-acetylglucosamine synthase-like glycosyltransferase
VIAVHDGERFIGAKLDSVLALDYPRELMEILVVSDGSTGRPMPLCRNSPREECACCGFPAAANARRSTPLSRKPAMRFFCSPI